MLIGLHAGVALATLAAATYSFIKPSVPGLFTGVGLLTLTVATGVWLIVDAQSHILSTCVSGLAYIGFCAAELVLARRKLVKQQIRAE